MTQPAVVAEERSGALWISLGRPPLNILDTETVRRIAGSLAPLPSRRDLKVVVLRSALAGTFSAGVDIADHVPERVPAMLEAVHSLVRLLLDIPQVTVASVDGACLGGACEIAAACDIVLATPRSSFGQPEIHVGCFPPVAAVLLPRLLGRAARELVLTGEAVSAAEAARLGLVNRVVDDLEGETAAVAARVARKSGAVLALARRALRTGSTGSVDDALGRVEALYRDELLRTHDASEGVRAFLEKRPPLWKDR